MHTLYYNYTDKPMRQPKTGQVIMPGGSYLEPPDTAHVELTEVVSAPVRVQRVADPDAYRNAVSQLRRGKEV